MFRTTSLSSVPLLTGHTGPAALRECPLESALSQEVTKFLYLGRCERGADFELTGSEGAPHAWQRPCLLEWPQGLLSLARISPWASWESIRASHPHTFPSTKPHSTLISALPQVQVLVSGPACRPLVTPLLLEAGFLCAVSWAVLEGHLHTRGL